MPPCERAADQRADDGGDRISHHLLADHLAQHLGVGGVHVALRGACGDPGRLVRERAAHVLN